MTDLLERKEYLVGITIIECRNIQGKDAAGTSDPFVKVRCADQIQQTTKKYEVNSAVWNQTLIFSGVKMNQYELETFELNLELYDHNDLLANELIGQYSLGLSTLYRYTNHEFYKVWISMWNREMPNKVQANLLITAFIVGPNERPPLHSADEDFDPDAVDDSDEDDDVIARKIEMYKKAQCLLPVNIPQMINKKYQLTITIVKSEGLPFCDTDKTVKPFISARALGCVLTTSTRSNGKAAFNAKMQFPIFYPILNDKITMRVWHKNGWSANVFIANIPEHPDQNDFFNISKILANDGRMTTRWINLYGTEPLDRNNQTKGRREGSKYLGRVLIAFSIIPNERPQLMSQIANPLNEPKCGNFQIWVDLYKLIECEVLQPGDPVWCEISCGSYPIKKKKKDDTEDDLIHWNYKTAKNYYKYKAIQVPPIVNLAFPRDSSQIPDIFIHFYTNTTWNKSVRFAYLRLKVVDCLGVNPKPSWLRLSTPFNHHDDGLPGQILTNVRFLPYDEKNQVERGVCETDKKSKKYYFYYQIYQGFEIATPIQHENLNTRVQISIGQFVGKDNDHYDKNDKNAGIVSRNRKGRYPVWNHCDWRMITLDYDLPFQADMKVTLQNGKNNWLGNYSDLRIGEFVVPVASLINRCNEPQFYNLLNEHGQFMGQVLCNFYLFPYFRDPKTRKQKDWKDPVHEKILAEFENAKSPKFTVNIDFAVLGLRNMIFQAERPMMSVWLTNDPDNPKVIKFDEEVMKECKIDATVNPNFGSVIPFKDVELVAEPLYWPFLAITIIDEAGGCETCFTTISLLDFADKILFEKDLIYAKQQIRRNQDQLYIMQYQIAPKAFMEAIGLFMPVDDPAGLDFDNLINDNAGASPDKNMPGNTDTAGGDGLRNTVMSNGQVVPQLAKGAGKNDGRMQGSINLFNDFGNMARGTVAPDGEADISMLGGEDKGGGDANAKFEIGGGGDEEESEDDFLNGGGGKKGGGGGPVESGVVIDPDLNINIPVTEKTKASEDKERQQKIKEHESHIKALLRKVKTFDAEHQLEKDKLRCKISDVTEEMEDLMEENMTEDKFWGMLAMNDDVAFDYGRDTLKENIYEVIMQLPYNQFPLFTKNNWGRGEPKPIIQVQGILRSGCPSGAIIKGQIKMESIYEDDEAESLDSDAKREALEKEKEQKLKGDTNANDAEWITETCNDISEKYPFNIIDPQYMMILNEDREKYVVRVYLIDAQNLAATGTVIDWKSALAGMTALSSANPYPVITCGGQVEKDRSEAMSGDLNPQFHKVVQFNDVSFPQDWKLTVAIWDKGLVSYSDNLIGATTIDIENRLYSNLLYMNKQSLEIEERKNKELMKLEKKKKGKKADKKAQAKLKDQKHEITACKQDIKKIEQILIPVEFRELIHPSKMQAQGIVQMWAEVMKTADAAKISPQKMQVIKKSKYEIRVIVWETRAVPLVDGTKVDIWVKVLFDPTGWPEDIVEKRTDVHKGSKSGWGLFNYRFKFELDVPCDFPRIKFLIFDEGMFTDEMIGEATINLKRTINKLEKEEFIEVPKTYTQCLHPNLPGEERGILMFSMTILPLEDAVSEPVGEAQDEPNENPTLKKPTVGRGLFDGGFAMDFNFDFAWNPFGKLLPWIGAIVCVAILIAAAYFLK